MNALACLACDTVSRGLCLSQHVDIMPTLLEVAAAVVIPPCASADTTANLCTMGRSRASLLEPRPPGSRAERAMEALMASDDNAAFSQYERPYGGIVMLSRPVALSLSLTLRGIA